MKLSGLVVLAALPSSFGTPVKLDPWLDDSFAAVLGAGQAHRRRMQGDPNLFFLTLWDAKKDQPLQYLSDSNSVINDFITGKQLNIEAFYFNLEDNPDAVIGSVVVDFNGKEAVQIWNEEPYTLFGSKEDSDAPFDIDYFKGKIPRRENSIAIDLGSTCSRACRFVGRNDIGNVMFTGQPKVLIMSDTGFIVQILPSSALPLTTQRQ